MTWEPSKVLRLAEVIAEQRAHLEIRIRANELQDKLFCEHRERYERLSEERDELFAENQRLREAVKRGRFALTSKERAKFDRGFEAVMGERK